MKPTTQSAFILATTLILGAVVGSLATGALGRYRMAQVEQLRERGGFLQHFERAISPHDQEQRSAIMPILEATAQRNRVIIDSARTELRTAIEEMVRALEPLLDTEQRRRISEVARFTDPFRPPPRPGDRPPGNPPLGNPPPGDRPPRGGPPPPQN